MKTTNRHLNLDSTGRENSDLKYIYLPSTLLLPTHYEPSHVVTAGDGREDKKKTNKTKPTRNGESAVLLTFSVKL